MPLHNTQQPTIKESKALQLLSARPGNQSYQLLGIGQQSVVYTDNKEVIKIFMSPMGDVPSPNEMQRIMSIEQYAYRCVNSSYLYPISNISFIDNYPILTYPYEESNPVDHFKEDELIGFLVEMWQRKLIFRNIKPDNFVRVEQQLKLIDYDLEGYTDNLFLNMCARSFIYLNYAIQLTPVELRKLCRSAINNFDLTELNGLQLFCNKVFSQIITEESAFTICQHNATIQPDGSEWINFNPEFNPEKHFFNKLREGYYLTNIQMGALHTNNAGYHTPAGFYCSYMPLKKQARITALLIKTCVQDVVCISENIKHIVKQLSGPNQFHKIVVSVDSKSSDFLRQYYSGGDLEGLLDKLQTLQSEKIIDNYLLFDPELSTDINQRWFGINSSASHTSRNIPLASQLYALEQIDADYILLVDSDILVGRSNRYHSFLDDMISELEAHPSVVSVGFNICQPAGTNNPYHGFEQGGFVPEVRCGLIDKQRLLSLRPLHNQVDHKGCPTLSWYRSLQITQQQKGFCSIRGGNADSFYIHPQNYRKTDPDAWMSILDRVEQNQIPAIQTAEFDCMGKLFDWCIPKCNNSLVVVSLLHNIDIGRFLRMWHSLLNQTYPDWQLILIDDHSDNGISYLIENLLKPYSHQVTFVHNRFRMGGMANLYKAIHYYIENPETIVVTLDADDALLGNDVLQTIVDTYQNQNADVVIGRVYQNYRLQAHYRYPANFGSPRDTGGNVWQHIRSFRKYLFDALDVNDLKYRGDNPITGLKTDWITLCSDYAYMVPLVELSQNPMQLERFCYYYDRSYTKNQLIRQEEEKNIAEVLSRKAKVPLMEISNRKRFIPNLHKIEIDLTYACNLKCRGCNRSCSQAPGTDHILKEQIIQFITESCELKWTWHSIGLLGGEPTLHPEFTTLVQMIIQDYIRPYSPDTRLRIVSNGVDPEVRKLLESLRMNYSEVYIEYGSYKSEQEISYFTDFNDAPIDDPHFRDADYSMGCWVTADCGINLNKHGYFACSLAGGINRVMQTQQGISSLHDLSQSLLQQQLKDFCPYCGNYKDYAVNGGERIPYAQKSPYRGIQSSSWHNIYQQYHERLNT